MANTNSYDVVVIGSGPGGYVAAVRAAQLGLKTAVVERDKALGGTCLLRGCIPTKFLLQTASFKDQVELMQKYGLTAGELNVDWKKTQTEKTKTVRRLSGAINSLMKKWKVDVHAGHGTIQAPGRVQVKLNDGGETTLETKNILIATGSYPKMLPFLKRDGERIITSDEALELKTVPQSLVVIGSGAVGSEFASIYNSMGSKVTLVEALPRMVPTEDEEISKAMEKAYAKRGIDVRTGTSIEGAEAGDKGVTVKLKTDKGETDTVEAEILLVAVGRGPVTDNLGLDTVGIDTDKGGFIPVDEYMRTKVQGIYAIGDVVPTFGLAHLASKEGCLAVEVMAGKTPPPIRYETCPNAIYSDPEVASVGYTEQQAKDKGYDVKVGKFPFTHNSKAMIGGHQEGMVKIVSDAKYDEVLGVHIMGYKATEMIAEGVLGMHLETTTEELFRAIHPHPTQSEAVMEAAENLHGESIHI